MSFEIIEKCFQCYKFLNSNTSVGFWTLLCTRGHDSQIATDQTFAHTSNLATNSFQYLHRHSVHSPSVLKSFIKGGSIRHLRNTIDQAELKTKDSEIEPIFQEITGYFLSVSENCRRCERQ